MASRSQSRTATDHDEIRQWTEARGGRPAVVKSTCGKGDDTGILRSNVPGYSGTRAARGGFMSAWVIAQRYSPKGCSLHYTGKKFVALKSPIVIFRKRLRPRAMEWEVSQTSRE